MGNAPSSLRTAIRWSDVKDLQKQLSRAGEKSGDLINNDYSQDCILQSCTRANGNAFYYAVSQNKMQIVPILLDNGADVHSSGLYGEPCILAAARSNFVGMVQLLLKYGADLGATDDHGRHVQHAAATTVYNSGAMLKFLIEDNGMDINVRDYNENTPLHAAAAVGNMDVVQYLLNHGADANASNKQGNTPLHGSHKYPAMWNILIEKGGNPDATNQQGQQAKDV